MSDQKTEDTKSPLARRGARPFAGPAGAPSAARPFLRPATTQRATAAPFLPPIVPGRPSLGREPQPAPAMPTPSAVAPIVAAPTAAPVAHAPTPAAIPPAMPEATFFPKETLPDASLSPASPAPDAEPVPSRARPITSEMVALDAFDAFDSVWGGSESSVAPAEPTAMRAPLDESSLGTGVDTQQLWADEITAGTEEMAVPSPAESTYPTPAAAMPAWLVDDAAHVRTPGADVAPDDGDAQTVDQASPVMPTDGPQAVDLSWPAAEPDGGYSIPAWTDAETHAADDFAPGAEATVEMPEALGSTVDAADEWPLAGQPTVVEDRPRFELVEEPAPVAAAPEPTPDPRSAHTLRIAVALDRLADRVRGGEIDVSFIAPDAPDAAVLASVLAALLGGSSGR